MPLKQVQPVMAYAEAHLDEDVSLAALANQAGMSVFHLHRVFSSAAGETPKQFTLRLRMGRAAAMLLTRVIQCWISRWPAAFKVTRPSAGLFRNDWE